MPYNVVIIGTAPNYNESLDGVAIKNYLHQLVGKVDDIIGLNCVIIDDDLRDICTKFITIDYFTCEYLAWYPWLQKKMYIDATVKVEADRRGVLQEANVFNVSKIIETELTNNNLYLNKNAPTVLHSALNLVLKLGLEKGINKENINVYLFGIELESDANGEWKHHNEDIYSKTFKKDRRTIDDMKLASYVFKNYFNMFTLNRTHKLFLSYYDIRKLINCTLLTNHFLI